MWAPCDCRARTCVRRYRTGLMSTTGVPSIASSGPTASSRPSIPSTVTSCRPSGFGRSDERVAKTPVSGRDSSSRGCTWRTLRSASCSHVTRTSRSPARIPWSASATDGSRTIHASGAPSLPWRGASARSRSGERTTPIGFSSVAVVRHGSRYLRCATRIWLPEGSRKPASTPYGCSVGSCWNSTPRSFSSSYVAWTSSVAKKSRSRRPWRRAS